MSDATIPERFIHVSEAAELTGIPARTIRKFVTDRKIPFYRFEGRICFYESELKTWIESHRVEQRGAKKRAS